jgi:hypothetical protein
MEELKALTGAPEGTTYPEHIITLKNTFKTAIGNAEFVKDTRKVEKIIAALTLVDPETRVRAQLETNAYKTLRAKAAKVAEETGEYVAPTLPEINAYIDAGLKVWRDKQK